MSECIGEGCQICEKETPRRPYVINKSKVEFEVVIPALTREEAQLALAAANAIVDRFDREILKDKQEVKRGNTS